MKNKKMFDIKTIIKFVHIIIGILILTSPAYAWTNGPGSPSIDPNNPAIGTHDKIIDSAIHMLPVDLQNKINIVAAEYGTEMPDYNKTACKCSYGLMDFRKHHVYFWKNNSVQDDSAAIRAQEEYDLAMKNLNIGDNYNFSIHVGMMSHYMSDISNFQHTMGNKTDWGAESPSIHGRYETYVGGHAGRFFSSQNITFDGKYSNITAYDATLAVAKDTTFDNKFGKGKYTNVKMNSMIEKSANSTFTDPKFIARVQQSLNYNVNMIADVLYTMVSSNISNISPTGDILSYYRGLGQNPSIIETADLLSAADDWRNNIIPQGFSAPLNTTQLLTLADEWRNAPPFANVNIAGFSFQPQIINVVKGTSIIWTNKDPTNHTVTSDTGLFDSGNVTSGGTYSFIFNVAGNYSYHCNIHTSMTGEVVVS